MNDLESAEPLPRNYFERGVEIVAPDLIGCYLLTNIGGKRVGGMIIETEAYDQNDVFSHCFKGNGIEPPESSRPMFFSPGSVYLYYSGQMLCLNIACDDRNDFGSAVLIRALAPMIGMDVMRERRMKVYQAKYLKNSATYQKYLCNGPANLCEALAIGDEHFHLSRNPLSAFDPPFELRSSKGGANWTSSQRYGLDKQLARMTKAGLPRGKFLEVQSHLERKWRWRISNDPKTTA